MKIIFLFIRAVVFVWIPAYSIAQPPVPTETGMIRAIVNEKGILQITPSANSAKNDFDFFFGKWKVHGTKLKARLQHSNEWIPFTAILQCSPILQGIANTEPFYMKNNGVDFEAFTLRLFDVKTKLWSIYFAWSGDVSMQNPQVGSFENNIGWFYARDVWDAKPIIIVYRWDHTNPDQPTMCQAFSTDEGKTWEWNYLQSFERVRD